MSRTKEVGRTGIRASAAAGRSGILAMDIGGTTTRLGYVAPRTGTMKVSRIATPNYLTHPHLEPDGLLSELLERICRCAADLTQSPSPETVVAGYPGPITDAGV